MRYNNYHKHDHYSNARTPDVIVKPNDYIMRAKELGHTTYFSTNHGCSANIYEAYGLCQENNIKCVYGMEMYYVDDRHEKDRNNKHIVVIGLTKNAYYEINRISSEANLTGFYYHPRVDLELLLSLPKDEVIITTACVNNRIFQSEDGVEKFLLPLHNHFGNNFMLEVQSHNHEVQKRWNRQILELSEQYNINIIHANDSHYILPEHSKDRREFLLGKNMNYGDEDVFILDYPEYDVLLERYKLQGILSDKQAKQAIENTLVFDKAEDLGFTKKIKMPTIYPELSLDERYNKLQHVVADKWKKEREHIPKEKWNKYKEAIKFEMNIIKETNEVGTADYFLINERIIDIGINKYDGILTRTGRGSAVSFYVNKLLGFTEIDRLDAEVPLYPTRFMSKSRILETKSLPDIDFNTANPNPFIQASEDVLGEDNVYYMLAYGTMQESAAFRNLCRARDLDNDTYNNVAKNLDEYRENPAWADLIEESKKFIGVIDSVAPSPCSFILLNQPVSKELGLMRVGDVVCACIDGYTSDVWKFLKNDILTVKVWEIISETYKLLDSPIPNIKELKSKLDKEVWDLYANRITATLNQVDSEWATNLMKRYSAMSVAELTAFVAAIRPGFASLLSGFLDRVDYSTEVEELDELLKDSFHYLLYQESIMKYLVWLGIHEDETYEIVKKISKKKFGEGELEKLKAKLNEEWIRKVGNDNLFEYSWEVIENSAKYSFNSAHALSVAWDSLYCAELKAHHPLEYYTVVLNLYSNDTEQTAKILKELSYFNIKVKPIEFGNSQSLYSFDKESHTIYKGISSIKFLNEQIADELYELAKNKNYDNFIDLVYDIKGNTSVNTRQLRILTGLNFFKRFGKNGKLIKILELYDLIGNSKQIKKDKALELELDIEMLLRYTEKETTKLYKNIDTLGYMKEFTSTFENKPLSVKEQVKFELEYLEYTTVLYPQAQPNLYVVVEYKVYKDKTKPYILLRSLKTGENLKTKVTSGKKFVAQPFELSSILQVHEFKSQYKRKLVNGEWIKSDEIEQILDEWSTY